MGSLKRFFLIEGFYFNGICTFAPVQGISTLCLYQNKGSTPTYLVHISNISSKDLQLIKYRASMEQAYNKVVSPIHVRYLSGICPVYVRYKSGHVPNKCRTYSGQRLEVHRRYAGATIWIEWRTDK